MLELDAALLKALKVENPLPLPDAFSVMGMVAGKPGTKRPSFYFQGATGPSGAILLGRFCHADAAMTHLVQEHLRAEEQLRKDRNAVFAEIAHLPEGRIGNVLFRPILRQYEIPYLATSRVAPEQQIPATDLMVSVRDDRVVLRSRKLDCEVLPRLTSAHGYAHGRNLKLYKFLCLLQAQNVTGGISWNWGMVEQLSFLPRVTLGNIVFSLARWRLEKEVIEGFAKEQGPERLRKVHEWRTRMGIPRLALLSEADNQLLIDFENVLSVETFVDYAKKRTNARLVEMFPAPAELCARGPEGAFTHEIVVPLVRKQPLGPADLEKQQPPAVMSSSGQRNFLPGSEWLFAKIYGSPSHLDRFLVEGLKPLVEDVLARGEADSWFFIRYGDPQWHLRLRFHGDSKTLSAAIMPRLWEAVHAEAQQEKVIRMQLDTYEREVERYGGAHGVEIAERLFQIDSELALTLLGAIAGRLGSDARWQLAFCSVDRLLAGLGLALDARRNLVNNMGKAQEKSFSVGPEYRKQLSEKFRKQRSTLEKILITAEETSEIPASAHSALAQFSAKVERIREQLEQAQQAGKLTHTIPELAGSYIHMHLNRMFRSTPNAQEMVLYDFLTRTYDSLLARRKTFPHSAAEPQPN